MPKISRRKGQNARLKRTLKEEAKKLGLDEIFAQFLQDCQFFNTKHKELTDKYPDRWIVVYREQVVGSGKNWRNLMWRLRRKGVPTHHAVKWFLPSKPRTLILLHRAA